MVKSKEVARFEGKGILVNPYTMRDPFTKWEKIQIILYNDKIEFKFKNNEIVATLDQIEDVDAKLPRRAIEIAKGSLEDLGEYSSITIKLPDRDIDIIGFAPETSIYGKTLINAFLKKLFFELLNKKEVKVQYGLIKGGSVDPSVTWENGMFVFAQKPVKKGVSIIHEPVLAIAVTTDRKPKVYDLFSNIESVNREKKAVDGEERDVLEIKQIKAGETMTSYMYAPQKETLFVLRYISALTKYHNAVSNLLPKTD